MNIIIFGATGGIGKIVTRLALEQGFNVTAFVRNPEKLNITHENLRILQGDAFNKTAVENAIANHDAVLSCLGSSNGLKKSTELEKMTQNIVDGMVAHGISRIIYIASAGIDGEIPGLSGKLIMKMLGNVLADHKKAVQSILQKDLEYTIVRPLGLTDKEFTGNYREAEIGVPEKAKSISRADVADFIIKALKNDRYIRTSISIAK